MSLGPDFDFKERVRQATDIVDLVGGYMTLRRVGAKYKGLCPWHPDTNPSLQVDPARQTWMCWVCHTGGDIFSFTMKKEGVDFAEALKILADRAGLELPRYKSAAKPAEGTEKPTLYKALQWAGDQFHQFLEDSPAAETARRYLDERGISPESIETFKIGYCPDAGSWLIDKARHASFSMETLLACGLVGKRADNASYYDWFRGRVMFPIFDTENRVVAFGGRILPEIAKKLEREQNRTVGKYVNSPETKLFSKSNLLYGLNLVREEVNKTRKLAIVEGYTDVVMAYQFGLRNTVAALGTAVNERHIRLMKRFADEVILVLDGDEAGQRRTNEILELFVASDLDMRVAVLPEGKDPCDFLIENDAPAFEEFLVNAADALEHKFRVETHGIDLIRETHKANEALERILKTLAQRPAGNIAGSGLLREQQMLARLARSFSLPEADLRLRLKQLRSRAPQRRGADIEQDKPAKRIDLNSLDKKEVELLKIILANPHIIEQAIENISPDQFVQGPIRELYETICELHPRVESLDFQAFLIGVDQPNLKTLLVELESLAQEKQLASLLTAEDRLQAVIEAFNLQINATSRRQQMSRIEKGEVVDDDELAALHAILQQNRIQKLKGHDLSAPMDG